MIREFFTTLRALPSIPQSDLSALARESARAFDLLIDFLRNEENIPHQSITALMTLMWHLIGNKEVPVLLDPSLPSMHFFCAVRRLPQENTAFYAVPYEFIELIRADPLMQCCALVSMGSRGCDYYSQRLDPAQTARRAHAYEAQLLLLLHPLMCAEGLPWELNHYLKGVLSKYPSGLGSLPADQRYIPPVYLIH